MRAVTSSRLSGVWVNGGSADLLRWRAMMAGRKLVLALGGRAAGKRRAASLRDVRPGCPAGGGSSGDAAFAVQADEVGVEVSAAARARRAGRVADAAVAYAAVAAAHRSGALLGAFVTAPDRHRGLRFLSRNAEVERSANLLVSRPVAADFGRLASGSPCR